MAIAMKMGLGALPRREQPKASSNLASAAPTSAVAWVGDRLSPQVRDPRQFAPYLQDQLDRDGTLNACGTTSAAMLLSFLKGKPKAVRIDQLDAHFRAFNGPTSPHNVASALASHGQQVSLKQNSSLEELARFVEQGSPALVLIDPNGDGQDKSLHYVLVTGVVRDAQGGIAEVKMADPWGDSAKGSNPSLQLKTVPAAAFDAKWADLKFMGHSTQMSRVLIAALPQDPSITFRGADGQLRRANALWRPEDQGLGLVPKIIDLGLDLANGVDAVVGWGQKLLGKIAWWQ